MAFWLTSDPFAGKKPSRKGRVLVKDNCMSLWEFRCDVDEELLLLPRVVMSKYLWMCCWGEGEVNSIKGGERGGINSII